MLAIGHSARDTYEMLLRRGVPMEQKPFQMGVRIEQPQETVNRVQYGRRPLWKSGWGRRAIRWWPTARHDLFTFCMCAGGYIMPSVSEAGYFCTNGMSLSKHDSPFANSGLVVTIEPCDFGGGDVLAGVRLQQRYEQQAFEVGRGELSVSDPAGERLPRGSTDAGAPANSYPRGAWRRGLPSWCRR